MLLAAAEIYARPLTDRHVIASVCALNLRINFAVLEQCLLQRRVLYNAK